LRELPPLDELFDMLDILRENGFEGTYEEMVYKLRHDPASLPFPKSAGPDFAEGGLATLFRRRMPIFQTEHKPMPLGISAARQKLFS
jgi:hypothetical protein